MTQPDLDSRIARLEAIEAIKALKARYWYCCDSKDVACQTQIVEMHHGGPPNIEVRGPDDASARWGLVYHLMNTEARTVSVVGGYYDDEYKRVDGQWWISKARFKVCSAVTYGWKDAAIRLLHAGAALPA
jgi:hypothetical protein